MQERRPQVERQREFNCAFLGRRIDLARGVAVILKPGQPPRLGLIGIDRLGIVAAAAGMGDVVDAAAERAAVPGINQSQMSAARGPEWSDAAPRPAARP